MDSIFAKIRNIYAKTTFYLYYLRLIMYAMDLKNYSSPDCRIRPAGESLPLCASKIVNIDAYQLNEEEYDW